MRTNGTPDIINDFLIYLENIQGKSPNTVKEYFYDLRTFFRFLKMRRDMVDESEDIRSIDIRDIDLSIVKSVQLSDLYAYISFLSNQMHNNARSRARKVASIRTFFKYLTNKAKLLSVNPAVELESPKVGSRNPVYLSLEESRELLASVDGPFKERDYAILTLFLNCGLRLSELVGINIGDIREDTLRVIGKGNKERTVYLNEACLNAIENYLKTRPHDGVKDREALFLSKLKKRISPKTVQHIVKKYISNAGLDSTKYSTHKLRHTAATLMYKYGDIDIRTLQQLLGHENISTTQIYTHVDNDMVRHAVNSNPLSQEVEHDK
ncbi:tyrosine recombinase XerC [Mahella sp.]|uniref:tyrosine recombinase XerC n=1 Tax=Mahella sp. TaxID=2798721 RepID=UPI0025BEC565|nr:tyrosine recombinase XerC [Mahella sp.]MBZ4664766.1 integrase family protein [Mahella sp.]MDK2903809.1 hypothetical protein [Clostridiales bacterium]